MSNDGSPPPALTPQDGAKIDNDAPPKTPAPGEFECDPNLEAIHTQLKKDGDAFEETVKMRGRVEEASNQTRDTDRSRSRSPMPTRTQLEKANQELRAELEKAKKEMRAEFVKANQELRARVDQLEKEAVEFVKANQELRAELEKAKKEAADAKKKLEGE